ncbi:LOW QUALITY PROTEIN: conserved hypothetical protein [Colletotrichum tofieldiae]|nr:LOW QUALITY PROTEIN: conserved hypothetical protein [Colletotrichum tofieldiae]GKT71877.1 LOW QUALITY PROTEIN: conserved hypothetical protein [Colletotrichum tofieldiae]
MPQRFGIWAAGGSLLIYYAPNALANWLEGLARAIRAGRDVRVAYNGDNQGGSGGAPVPDSISALAGLASNTNVRFTVPVEVPSLEKRYTSEEGTVDMKMDNEYLYTIATGELTYEASQAAFPFGPSDALVTRASDLDKRQTRDYTILLRSARP